MRTIKQSTVIGNGQHLQFIYYNTALGKANQHCIVEPKNLYIECQTN